VEDHTVPDMTVFLDTVSVPENRASHTHPERSSRREARCGRNRRATITPGLCNIGTDVTSPINTALACEATQVDDRNHAIDSQTFIGVTSSGAAS
jgi:hypothetical protein